MSLHIYTFESVPYLRVRVLIEGVEIEAHRGREHHRVLRNDAEAGPQVLHGDGTDVDVVYEDFAIGQILDAKQSDHQARFS